MGAPARVGGLQRASALRDGSEGEEQMHGRTPKAIALARVALVLVLAGCGALPQQNAVEIVAWQQAERDRLEAQGFVQYTWH